MKICTNCGTQCEDIMNFCSNCGTALGAAAAAEEAVSEAVETAGEAVPEAEELTEEVQAEAAEAVEEAAAEAAETAEEVQAEAAETVEETAAEAAEAAEEVQAETADAAEKVQTAAETAAAVQPSITIEEDNSTIEMPEPQIRDAAQAEAEDAAAAAAGTAAGAAGSAVQQNSLKNASKPVKRRVRRKKPVSVMAVLSLIFSLIGIVSGGYGCLFTFMDLKTAALFFIPSLLGVVFGLIGLAVTGRERKKRGMGLAVAGIIIGGLSIVLWIVGSFYLHNVVREKYGTTDLMSAVRTILGRK